MTTATLQQTLIDLSVGVSVLEGRPKSPFQAEASQVSMGPSQIGSQTLKTPNPKPDSKRKYP